MQPAANHWRLMALCSPSSNSMSGFNQSRLSRHACCEFRSDTARVCVLILPPAGSHECSRDAIGLGDCAGQEGEEWRLHGGQH